MALTVPTGLGAGSCSCNDLAAPGDARVRVAAVEVDPASTGPASPGTRPHTALVGIDASAPDFGVLFLDAGAITADDPAIRRRCSGGDAAPPGGTGGDVAAALFAAGIGSSPCVKRRAAAR